MLLADHIEFVDYAQKCDAESYFFLNRANISGGVVYAVT